MWIYDIRRVRPAGRLPCVAKTRALEITHKNLHKIRSNLPASGILDLFHFIPLSVTVTLSWSHKIGGEQNLLTVFSHAFSADQHEIKSGVEAIQTE